MKDWIVTAGALTAATTVVAIVFMMFYGMHAGATVEQPKYYNHGPQDPHDTQ